MEIKEENLFKYLDVLIFDSKISELNNCPQILYDKYIRSNSKNDRYDDLLFCDKIFILGLNLGFIKSHNSEKEWFELTEKGISAKSKGGYFKYLEFIENKELDKIKPTIIAENYISGDNHGIQSSRSDFIKPAIKNASKITETKPPKKSFLEIASWVFGGIAAIIAIYEFVIKKII